MTEEELRNVIYKRLTTSGKDEKIDRLTIEQMKFVVHDLNTPCYLEACPGSGKTEVVGFKAAFELIEWKKKFSGIAIVSFTNNASIEIEKRVKKYAGSNAASHPHYIGTLDSFFYNYVLCPFFYGFVGFKGVHGDHSPRAIVDERSDADFLKGIKYKPKTLYAVSNPNPKSDIRYVGIPIPANRFHFDVIKNDFVVLPTKDARTYSSLREILNRPEQKAYHKDYTWLTYEIVREGFLKAKKAFWKDGFLTFRDWEYLIYQILKSKKNIREKLTIRFPYLLIDECQDLSPMQLMIINMLVKDGLKIHLIGDLHQSIYKFREVRPKIISKFIEHQKLVLLPLTYNFRSNQPIVNLFSNLYTQKLVGNEPGLLKNSLVLIEYEESEISKLIHRYSEIIDNANNEISKERINRNNSAIIIRGTTLLNRFRPFKASSNNPFTILATSLKLWKGQNRKTKDLQNAIKLFGFFLSKVMYKNNGNARYEYCQEGIKYVNWRISLSILLDKISEKLYPFENKKSEALTFSKWAKEVKSLLPELMEMLPVEPQVKSEEVRLRVESALGDILVSDHTSEFNSENNFRTTTIHEIKGKTLDSIMIVSSLDRRSKGGHWKDWFNNSPYDENEEEHKRYGYVALSRPKHLLVLATPKLNTKDKKFFTDLGFKIESLKTVALF